MRSLLIQSTGVYFYHLEMTRIPTPGNGNKWLPCVVRTLALNAGCPSCHLQGYKWHPRVSNRGTTLLLLVLSRGPGFWFGRQDIPTFHPLPILHPSRNRTLQHEGSTSNRHGRRCYAEYAHPTNGYEKEAKKAEGGLRSAALMSCMSHAVTGNIQLSCKSACGTAAHMAIPSWSVFRLYSIRQ